MKRTLCALLSALFLSTLAIPCSAADTAIPKIRDYPGFADVAEESWCYDAVKLCYESGLMNGTSETTFGPQGPLTAAQLVVLTARLYDLRNGGSGAIPALPDLAQPYLRFLGPEGDLLSRLAPEGQARDEELFAQSASRVLFAWLTDFAAGELSVLHETVSVPDVTEDTQDADSILRLYRSGILTGVDASGRFHGDGTLTRAQAAVMLSRVLDPRLRI